MTHRPAGTTAAMEGIERLRALRGDEQVTFGDVADHFADFVERDPAARDVVGRLAAFLAEVERVDHDHENDPGRGLVGTPGVRGPRGALAPYGWCSR